jgi:hypothetical protein
LTLNLTSNEMARCDDATYVDCSIYDDQQCNDVKGCHLCNMPDPFMVSPIYEVQCTHMSSYTCQRFGYVHGFYDNKTCPVFTENILDCKNKDEFQNTIGNDCST